MIDQQTAKRRGMPAVILDGDDTLWQTEPLYDEARTDTATYVSSLGIDSQEFEQRQREVDLERAASLGVARVRFPGSSVEAARSLAASHSIQLKRRQLRRVSSISSEVFQKKAPTDANAADVIARLRDRFQIALLTKGDEEVQRKRLADSGLAPLLDFAHIVDQKDEDSFRYVLSRLQANPLDSWTVGNSFRSDIVPALSFGMRAIWVEADAWALEDAPEVADYTGRYLTVKGLDEVPDLITKAGEVARDRS